MAQVLKLYWSHSKPNFGDWLSPAICRALAHKEVRYAGINRCDMVALGSLLERLPKGLLSRKLHVWGTGSIEEHPVRDCKHTVHALRGPRTAALLKQLQPPADQPPVFGDPGLLSELLLPLGGRAKPHIDLGLIPHYKDANRPTIAQLIEQFPRAEIINVFDSPEAVVARIARCHHVMSSSLHGLIVADALGVPSRWLKLSDSVRGGPWKFKDYYASFDEPLPERQIQPLTPNELVGQSLDAVFEGWQAPRLEAQKKRLADAFPNL